eukprot:TRINITY_DN7297_c0_g1_i1.p1 TRINITY_DN7297_c0_g1~~TRINITY_DN7297_c0_g1_i1.p1  ORF type:complete len:545 (-),score=117.17 TRINITY_DN7297_c0_g1_i1:79-1713(-)
MYKLDALLKDVSQKRGKLQAQETEHGVDNREVWNTYLSYVRSCLEQRRGLVLSNFCKIGWQTDKKYSAAGGKPAVKPFFQITEQFARAYCSNEAMRKIGAPTNSDLGPFEDFNFSKAAIKFSNLTKDQVFSGLRAIVQQLGDAIAEGRDVDIEFGDLGRLTSREKEPKFHFSQAVYSLEGLDAPPAFDSFEENQTSGPRSGAAFRRETPEEARGLEMRGMGAGGQGGGYNARRPATPAPVDDFEQGGYGGNDFYGGGGGYNEDYDDRPPATGNSRRQQTPSSSAPSLQLGTAAQRSHVLTGQQFKREVAFKEAMDRHIGEMESRASEAMLEKSAWSRHVNDCLTQERDDIIGKRVRMRENQHFVQQQKLLNEEKRKEQRQEDIIAASAHDFPKFTEPAEADMKDFIQGQQARLRSDLDEQVRTNATLKNLAKQRERTLEVNQLEANRAEMSMLRDAERAKKIYDKEALATAWNSEIRMKNIWKAIDNHNKVGSQQPQVMSTDGLPPSRGGESTRNAGRLMTGSSRRVPLGASRSLGKLEARGGR